MLSNIALSFSFGCQYLLTFLCYNLKFNKLYCSELRILSIVCVCVCIYIIYNIKWRFLNTFNTLLWRRNYFSFVVTKLFHPYMQTIIIFLSRHTNSKGWCMYPRNIYYGYKEHSTTQGQSIQEAIYIRHWSIVRTQRKKT